MSCPAFECLYHGTRGPGKTDALLMDFAQHVGQGFGAAWRGVLLRRQYPDLAEVIAKSNKWFGLAANGGRYNKAKSTWTWPTGEELLFRQFKNPDDYPDNLPTEHPLTQARIAVQAARGAVASFGEEARQIRGNRNLTGQGKAAALGEAGNRKLAEIDFPSVLAMLRSGIAELRKAREPDRSKDDSAARAIREWEIRDHLLERGEPDRLQIFNHAIENGDRLIFDAAAKAPAFLAILPPDVIAQGQEAWLDQRSPEAAAKLRDMTRALAEVENAIRVARREIASEAGLPGDDPVRAMANGEEAAA